MHSYARGLVMTDENTGAQANIDEIRKHIDRKGLEKLVDPANYLGVAGDMVDRVLAMRGK